MLFTRISHSHLQVRAFLTNLLLLGLVKHANSTNFYLNIELPEKYKPELEEGTTNSV